MLFTKVLICRITPIIINTIGDKLTFQSIDILKQLIDFR